MLVTPLLYYFYKIKHVFGNIYIHTPETVIEILVLPSSCPGTCLRNNSVPIW